ncbi:uncharacterized protein [Littorina saxatilis]|uniref:uncharacterized protein n=1 Tax=Littorina saxatilis TaxID=31220 RepID=UPI0038B65B13
MVSSGTSRTSSIRWITALLAFTTRALFASEPYHRVRPDERRLQGLGGQGSNPNGKPYSLGRDHVVPGTLYTAGIRQDDLHTFEEAVKIHLGSRFGSTFTVDSGHLMRNGDDLSAANGVVHKIDKVLIPESLKNQI